MKICISGYEGEGKTTIGMAIAKFLREQGFQDVTFDDDGVAALRADHPERLKVLAGRTKVKISTRCRADARPRELGPF